VRRVLIPKADKPGALRPLGISNVEDKLVQMMMHKLLEAIYEPLFLDCSYGFRPGRGPHDAVRALHQYVFRHEVSCVIDVDLANYFDSINHNRLLTRLEEKIKDRRFLRTLSRMLKAGVLNEGELTVDEEGVAQGSVCSPILANVYAHYVIDEWFEGTVKRHCYGEAALFRYADDLVICCQYERDAIRIQKALAGRLAKYGLTLNEEKTRRVDFSRTGASGEFSFLGFTFYQGKSRRGNRIPKVKTDSRRLRRKLTGITTWAKQIRSKERLSKIWQLFCAKVRGHIRYYGVSFNLRAVCKFVYQALRILYKWLNRRSQRRSFTWEKFRGYVEANPLPRIAVYHSLYG
jgi:RNA-directed DNA polymerase